MISDIFECKSGGRLLQFSGIKKMKNLPTLNVVLTLLMLVVAFGCRSGPREHLDRLHGAWVMDFESVIAAMPVELREDARNDIAGMAPPRVDFDCDNDTILFHDTTEEAVKFSVVSTAENVIRLDLEDNVARIEFLPEGKIKIIFEEEETDGRFVDTPMIHQRVQADGG